MASHHTRSGVPSPAMKRLLATAIALAACDKTPSGTASDHGRVAAQTAETTKHGAGEQTVATGDPCAKAQTEGAMVMPWIADDLPAALACAARRDVPVVVDLWAPWCHTCLSMQSTVFTDPSFQADAPRFVFAALDTDKAVNAAAVGKYPPSAWPTFYVIGKDRSTGQTDAVLARFVGAASLAQFHAVLEAGVKAQQGGAAGADAHLLGAERAIALKDLTVGEQELTAALAMAPADWSRRPDALTSLIGTKLKRKDFAGCLELAEKSLDDTGKAAAATDFIVSATSCIEQLKGDAAMADRVKRLRERAVARLAALTADAGAPLSVDDRSDALATLRELLDELDRHPDAVATAQRQRALLDDAAAKATAPMARMTYNWQRCDVYVYLGVPLELVPALEQSAKDLPTEYDPRARLGWLYLKADKLAEAATWTDAALALVYGPRKARLLSQRAEIAAKQHDKAGEKHYRQEVVKLWESLPPGQANPDALTKAKQTLAALDPTTAATP